MSSYLYLPSDGKDKKDHIYAYILSCKILFQLTVTVFEENVN